MITNNSIMDEHEQRVKYVANEIEQYLCTHPYAADSLEGIAMWWVSRQKIRNEIEVVHAALELLVQSGVVNTDNANSERGPVYHLKNKNH